MHYTRCILSDISPMIDSDYKWRHYNTTEAQYEILKNEPQAMTQSINQESIYINQQKKILVVLSSFIPFSTLHLCLFQLCSTFSID
jgi:hypothetical protein